MRARLLVVLLVILLGLPECRGRADRRHDLLAELLLLAHRGRARSGGLTVREREDRTAILISVIGALAIERRRVVVREEEIKESLIRDLLRIELDQNRFRVAGRVRADRFVCRLLGTTTRVADRRR